MFCTRFGTLTLALLFLALSGMTSVEADVLNYVTNGDFEATTFTDYWQVVDPVAGDGKDLIYQTTGLDGTGSAAWLEANEYNSSAERAEIRQYFTASGPDWQLDMTFAAADPNTDPGKAEQRSMHMTTYFTTGGFICRVTEDHHFQVYDNVNASGYQTIFPNAIEFSSDTDGDKDFSDNVLNTYRLRINGHFDSSTPTYDVMLSEANSDEFVHVATGLQHWLGPAPQEGDGFRGVVFQPWLADGHCVVDDISVTDGSEEVSLPGIQPVSVYDYSDTLLENYPPEHTIDARHITEDGTLFPANYWVGHDDSGSLGSAPITGHIVYDLGTSTALEDMAIWASDHGNSRLPEQVKVFGFADDDPTNIDGAIDDIESDPNIVEIWSGTLEDLIEGERQDVLFDTSFTGRYVGLRVDSCYGESNNFQFSEIRFNVETEGLDGDLNSDGFVGGDDLDIVRSFWGQSVTSGDLLAGDPSGDGFVGGDDLDIVRANWGQGTPPAPSSVPEPGLLVFIVSGMAALAVSRRRAH